MGRCLGLLPASIQEADVQPAKSPGTNKGYCSVDDAILGPFRALRRT